MLYIVNRFILLIHFLCDFQWGKTPSCDMSVWMAQTETINRLTLKKNCNSHPSDSGSIQFIQLCHQWFYQDTSSRWQTRKHRPVCLCRPGLCFYSGAQDVLLNEKRRVEAWLCWRFIHWVSLGGQTLTNKSIQYQRTCPTDLITDCREITGLLSLCHPLLSFHHAKILWT